MSINKVALIGATGNVGPAVLNALLDAGFEVTILSREGSTSTDALTSHPQQKIIKVNFDDVQSISSALSGVEGLVSNVASHAILSQKHIIDAAVAAGVKRFLPSDFGSDLSVEANRLATFNASKVDIHRYLAEKVKTHPNFSFTSIANGPFLDWCLRFGLFGDLKTHDMTLWEGGETLFSTTTLASVGKAVVGVFQNPDATKNKDIRIADTTITQKQIIEIVKELDGEEWTTRVSSLAEAHRIAVEEMQKPEPNMMLAITNQLYEIIFDERNGVNYEGKLDNDKVGLTEMTREEVKQVIKSCLP